MSEVFTAVPSRLAITVSPRPLPVNPTGQLAESLPAFDPAPVITAGDKQLAARLDDDYPLGECPPLGCLIDMIVEARRT